ncbi:hypothetical protein XPR_3902, partial [Xanthomonas arboricola pv. pruni MAFF 301420]
NLRPSGYEPDELPDCSTPQQKRNYEELERQLQALVFHRLKTLGVFNVAANDNRIATKTKQQS